MPYIPDMKGLGFVEGMVESPNKNMSPLGEWLVHPKLSHETNLSFVMLFLGCSLLSRLTPMLGLQ